MTHRFRQIYFIFISLLFVSCGGTTLPTNPVDEMKKEFENKEAYTIMLYDMDLHDKQYVHQYKIFELVGGKNVVVKTTDWKPVDDDFFMYHEDDLGMEIFSKLPDRKYNHLVSPPGFTHFVGNSNFGEWSSLGNTITEDSSRLWIFDSDNEQALKVQKEFGLEGLHITKGEYTEFENKYYLNRPFYGPQISADTSKYGTNSPHLVMIRPLFYTRLFQKNKFNKPYDGSYGNRGGGGFGK